MAPTFQSRQRWATPGRVKKPGSEIVYSGVRRPSSSAIIAMNGLNVEPGG